MNGKFCSSEVMMKDRLSTNLKMKKLENEISETVVYMECCRIDRGVIQLWKTEHDFRRSYQSSDSGQKHTNR
jgi:hypothetical protein